MKRFVMKAAIVSLTVLALGGASTMASATEPLHQKSETTANNAAIADLRADLAELALTQSDEDINAVANGDAPAVVLIDDAGNPIAAIETTAPGVTGRAVSVDTPLHL